MNPVAFLLPTLEPGFWLPPWRTSPGGIVIPMEPPPPAPTPDGGIILRPGHPYTWGRRDSGLLLPPRPLPTLIWLTPMGTWDPPAALTAQIYDYVSREYSAADIAGGAGSDCPCVYCAAQRRAEEAAGEYRPAPVYDHAPLEPSSIDNDRDPQWATRAESEGPGLLLEELLDDSTIEYLKNRDRKRGAR